MPKKSYLNKNKIKKWIKKNKVTDVILFGSFVRDKSKPNDVDLCILIKGDQEKDSIDLVDSLSKILSSKLKIQINILTQIKLILGSTLSRTLIEEGISILKNKKMSELLGYQSKSMFVYSLRDFTSSKRVRFHYMLNGRYGQKGILKQAKAEIIGNGVITCDVSKEDLLKEVFNMWNVKYKTKRMLI